MIRSVTSNKLTRSSDTLHRKVTKGTQSFSRASSLKLQRKWRARVDHLTKMDQRMEYHSIIQAVSLGIVKDRPHLQETASKRRQHPYQKPITSSREAQLRRKKSTTRTQWTSAWWMKRPRSSSWTTNDQLWPQQKFKIKYSRLKDCGKARDKLIHLKHF